LLYYILMVCRNCFKKVVFMAYIIRQERGQLSFGLLGDAVGMENAEHFTIALKN